MKDTTILVPMFALVAWTFCVLLRMAQLRIFSGLHPVEFAFGESEQVPPRVRLANRNYMNLLELPMLFYVAGGLLYVSGAASATAVALAWSYVGLRIVHSLIHLGRNRVMHRLAAFALSNFVLMALWIVAALQLLGR